MGLKLGKAEDKDVEEMRMMIHGEGLDNDDG